MTAVVDAPPEAPIAETVPAEPLARWHVRAGALAVDVLPGLAVVATTAPWFLAGPRIGWSWWVLTAVAVLALLAVIVNRVLVPSLTGWTLGRALVGIRVVRRDGGEAGLGRLLLRELAHLLDTAGLFVGWLWPLWDRRNRTFADLLVRTEARPVVRPERDMRRFTAKVLIGVVVVAAVAVAVTYLTVYRQEQALDQSRAQIAEQGPRIVEQMLSFGVETMDEDFSRAQSLTTEAYRPQLVAQQDVARKAGATTNEYWAVSSAVLSSSKNEAAMLLAMQGQRGTKAEDLKFITATVRVDFDKIGDNWRVDSLAVLKAPAMQGGGQ
ncbi:RDD family protein [Mycolicibacterium litorale]|uniref:RDD family protein n=1 Tax=Mycolicibacterium litorale TaxID=758802 RepID=A0AAD1IPT2_9MYCO|nr:RDD family protein [Mycolicibacterium litorale]MCV7417240.1 RDD family protein [Mycolicibacterium litorale]TDY05028.1 Mce-associated membrane protein [Mycolicibacterium litorale]BBY18458.1 RDD family protein [Mycolicibacterium litorale]